MASSLMRSIRSLAVTFPDVFKGTYKFPGAQRNCFSYS